MSNSRHPGLMPESTPADLGAAWAQRDAEASALDAAGHSSMAIALRLYSLEIRLKAMICGHLGLQLLPGACKTHDLGELLLFTGLWGDLRSPGNNIVLVSWDLLAEFSKKRLNDLRYQPAEKLEDAERAKLAAALDDPNEGVLPWLSRPR